ncbi:secreted protein [Streptomyces viridochromogenes DSM 40736]|uniref:Secreted protein n=1 Tax=Streptomyces viridochromogenes (strain DSM 40736 / JCM 4977 / BCRC 1201 / Tue 494) TaxID=591159 RepID=D9X3K1_STRVT|nr:secreted protein [Streptomyces viridochromogenes DSM 40736]
MSPVLLLPARSSGTGMSSGTPGAGHRLDGGEPVTGTKGPPNARTA